MSWYLHLHFQCPLVSTLVGLRNQGNLNFKSGLQYYVKYSHKMFIICSIQDLVPKLDKLDTSNLPVTNIAIS